MTYAPMELTRQTRGVQDLIRLVTWGHEESLVGTSLGIFAGIVPAAPDQSIANVALCTAPEELWQDELAKLARGYHEAGVRRWRIWVPNPLKSPRTSTPTGYEFTETLTGMRKVLQGPQRGSLPAPDGLDWSMGDLVDVGTVNSAAHAVPALAVVFTRSAAPRRALVYRANHAGKVACVLSCTYNHRVCGISSIATVPAARGIALAPRLLAVAMRDALERGCRSAIVQAPASSVRLYYNAGFRPTMSFDVFTSR